MKIQKGIVKYKDRNDIVCTYGITDDGKQYYFLGDTNDKKFTNGNRVASTLLVEAIDPMVKASNIGIIDENGNVVIPFENKSIRLVNDSIIVVEKAVPVSQSVVDAIEMRNDPLSATKLVSTPAAIKDKLYAQMGNDSRFVFNDQFSEATVCDINGNNLVNNEFYSFIAVANNKLYFSKNIVDSPIAEYSLLPPEVQSDVTPANDGNEIDVSNVNVESNVVENAMGDAQNNGMPPVDDLNAVKEMEENQVVVDVPAIPEVPAIPDATVDGEVVTPVDSGVGMSLPQVEADTVGGQELESVAQVPDGVDTGASVVDDINAATEENPADSGVVPIAPPVEEDVVMDYDDSLSHVVDETGTNTDENVEEDVVMEYDDSLSHVVDETITNKEENIEEDVVMDYDDSLSHVVDETADNTSVNVETEEVKFNENVTEDTNTLEDVPPVDDLPPVEEEDPTDEEVKADEEIHEEETPVEEEFPAEEKVEEVPPVEEEELEYEEPVDDGGITISNTEIDKDISSVVDEISGDVKGNYDIDALLNTTEENIFTKTIKTDKIDTSLDDFDTFTSDYKVGSSDTIMTDIAKSMTELMKQNREQRALLAEYQEKFDVMNAQKKVIAEKYKDQAQKLEAVANKYRNLETTATRLETRNQLLESKISEQDRLINAQERELGSLRPQLQGKENLVKILADAKALLGSDDSYM